MSNDVGAPSFDVLDLFLGADIFPDTLSEIENVLSGKVPMMEQHGNACSLMANKDDATICFLWHDDFPEVKIQTQKLKALVEERIKLGRVNTP